MALKIRDPEEVRTRLTRWLAHELGPDFRARGRTDRHSRRVGVLVRDAAVRRHLDRRTGRPLDPPLVTRFPPGEVLPVFPRYDLGAQARCMQLVAEHTDVPVPSCRWLEEDETHLGSPFLIMDRIDGRVPPDRMPYTFGSWLTEATDADRAHLEKTSVEVLAGIHTITPDERRPRVPRGRRRGRHAAAPARQRPVRLLRVGPRGGQVLVDRGHARLARGALARVRERPGPGMGRRPPGNILYDGFTPVGVLDWEMATVAPPEMDIGWMHLPPLVLPEPDRGDGASRPSRATSTAIGSARSTRRHRATSPRDIEWFEAYSALRHGIIMTRTSLVEEAEGRAEPPDDPNDRILHRVQLEAILDGTYFS